MKVLKISILTFLLFPLFQNYLYSQVIFIEGFIVKNNGDSLTGLIKYETSKNPLQTITFKRFDIAIPVKYSIENLLAYGFVNANRYERKVAGGETQFVECIVKGPISLYSNGKVFYIEKKIGTLVKLTKEEVSVYTADGQSDYKDYNELLKAYTADISGFTLPTNFSLKTKDLKEIVENYNSLSNRSYIAYNRTIDYKTLDEATTRSNENRRNFGLIGTLQVTKSLASISGSYFDPLPALSRNHTNSSFGAFYQYNFWGKNNFSIRIDGLFSVNNDNILLIATRKYPTEKHYAEVSLKKYSFSVPLSVQYTKSLGKVSPYINAGIIYHLIIGFEENSILDVQNNQNEIYSYIPKENDWSRGEKKYVPFLGIGVKYNISSNYYFFFETRTFISMSSFQNYKYNYYYSPNVNIEYKTPVTFLLGIGF